MFSKQKTGRAEIYHRPAHLLGLDSSSALQHPHAHPFGACVCAGPFLENFFPVNTPFKSCAPSKSWPAGECTLHVSLSRFYFSSALTYNLSRDCVCVVYKCARRALFCAELCFHDKRLFSASIDPIRAGHSWIKSQLSPAHSPLLISLRVPPWHTK